MIHIDVKQVERLLSGMFAVGMLMLSACGDSTTPAPPAPTAEAQSAESLLPPPSNGYRAEPTMACLARNPGVDVWIVTDRPLGGSRGTLRFKYDEFEAQLAFGANPTEARAIVEQATRVAQAMGVEGVDRFVGRWRNVAASWGAVAPTNEAAQVVVDCLRPRR